MAASREVTGVLTMDIDEDLRILLSTTPILTREAAGALTSTAPDQVASWTAGSNPAVQRPRRVGRSPYAVGFAGLLEVDLMHRLVAHGVPRRRAGSVLRSIRSNLGDLAIIEKPEYVTDGTDLFRRDGSDLTRLRDKQGAFSPVLRDFLSRVRLDTEGRVEEYIPEQLDFLSVNPLFNGGGLSHTATRVPVSSLVGSLEAGAHPAAVAANFRVPLHDVEALDERRGWALVAAE